MKTLELFKDQLKKKQKAPGEKSFFGKEITGEDKVLFFIYKNKSAEVTLTKITESELREIQEIYQEAQHLTFTTGVQYDVDHIIPLFEGGLHHPDNLQIIAHEEHLMKTAKENSRRQQK